MPSLDVRVDTTSHREHGNVCLLGRACLRWLDAPLTRWCSPDVLIVVDTRADLAFSNVPWTQRYIRDSGRTFLFGASCDSVTPAPQHGVTWGTVLVMLIRTRQTDTCSIGNSGSRQNCRRPTIALWRHNDLAFGWTASPSMRYGHNLNSENYVIIQHDNSDVWVTDQLTNHW